MNDPRVRNGGATDFLLLGETSLVYDDDEVVGAPTRTVVHNTGVLVLHRARAGKGFAQWRIVELEQIMEECKLESCPPCRKWGSMLWTAVLAMRGRHKARLKSGRGGFTLGRQGLGLSYPC
uniref:Uncharacterized protein n=1 Tax=Oryza brachyantha TaxID=4533 RepID=J3LA84_ORYBR